MSEPSTSASAEWSYLAIVATLRLRFLNFTNPPRLLLEEGGEYSQISVEWQALQVRQVCESVAFICLSSVERRAIAKAQRAETPMRLLAKLVKNGSATLPQAQNVTRDSATGLVQVSGAADRNVALRELETIWGNASEALHFRHPERAQATWWKPKEQQLQVDMEKLKQWLWTHTTSFENTLFLVQMSLPDNLIFNLAKVR